MKKYVVFVFVVALVLSFSPNVKAGVMDAGEDSAYMLSDGNKEFALQSGYYFQQAIMPGPDAEEHGFSIGFELSRFLSETQLFGLNLRSSLSVEPDFMVGFIDSDDHTLSHFSAPVFAQFDFPMETNPVEISAGVGTGLLMYDLGNQIAREAFMPVIGKLAVSYVKHGSLKIGVETKGHYVVNRASGPISRLWGISVVAGIYFLF